jgi:hypothetical protein
MSSNASLLFVGAFESFTDSKPAEFGVVPFSQLAELRRVVGSSSLLSGTLRLELFRALDRKDANNLIIDERLLDNQDVSRFINGAKEINTYEASSQQLYRSKRFDLLRPPPRWFAEVEKCCLFSRRPPRFAAFRALKQQSFRSQDVQIVSFYSDSKTEAALDGLSATVALRSPGQIAENNAEAHLERIFSAANNKAIIVIGHVEKGSTFVAENESGKELFRIEVAKIQELSDKFNVNLILLGCFTEAALQSNAGSAIGSPEALSPIRVVEQLSNALSKSGNWLDFLHNLSAADLHLVAGDTFMKRMAHREVDAANISILRGASGATKEWVGEIWLRFKCRIVNC